MMVEATHLEGLRFALASGQHAIETDQRVEYGGEDSGPMPSELFLWSVAACFGQAVAHVARKMRTPLGDLRLEVHGTKASDVARFARVQIVVEARCEAERLDRIAALARKHCFITNSISPTVEVLFELRARA